MKLPVLPNDRLIATPGGTASDSFWLFLDGVGRWLRGNGGSIYGTAAQRTTQTTRGYINPRNVADGTLYRETDTGLTYELQVGVWLYSAGIYQRTQSQLATLSGALGANDAGLLVEVTDYAHVLRWAGAAWEWGPGEEGGGYFRPFAVAPTGAGWHACDGSAGIKYLKADGTTGTVTLPNTAATAAYLQAAGAYVNAITPATVPTIAAPTFTGTPVTPAGTVGAIGATGSVQVAAGTGSSAGAAQSHTHPAPTFTGTPFTPAGTNSAPTATLPGDPVANFQAVLYFRQ